MNPVSDALASAASVVKELERRDSSKLDGNTDSALQASAAVTSTVNGVEDHNTSPANSSNSVKPAVSDVLRRLEQLIVTDEWQSAPSDNKTTTNGSTATSLSESGASTTQRPRRKSRIEAPRLSELSRNVVTSFSLRAYIDMLAPNHRYGVANWLHAHTSQLLSSMFRFPKSLVHVNDDHGNSVDVSLSNGVLHVCRLALRNAYPTLADQGYAAVMATPPVIYVSPAVRLSGDVLSLLRSECGVEHVVVAPALEGPLTQIEARVDHEAFGRLLVEDKEKGRRPILVVACVGSTIFGQNDMISKLLELRKEHPFWLHVVGGGLATLGGAQPPEHLRKVLSQVDSMTLKIGQWLGVPPLVSVTLHRPIEARRATYREKVATLPLWVALNTLTPRYISSLLDQYLSLNKIMVQELSRFGTMRIIGIDDTVDYAQKVACGAVLPPCVLVFKYDIDTADNMVKSNSEEAKQQEDKACGIDSDYVDCLNLWIGQGLFDKCAPLEIHFIELHNIGTALRFCPLETAAQHNTTGEHVRQFGKQLSDVLNIVDATVRARRSVPAMLAQHPSLRRVNLSKWAGAGAVVYVPSIVDENQETSPSDWNEQQRQQISHLNIELVHMLRGADAAFSTGEAVEGVSCVKFGMLADERDLADLIRLVAQRGSDLEQSSQYLESLAELVRQGIEAANEDLRRENEEKLVNEGVMRQLPMVGSLLNWWSPLPPEHSHVKGRSFDLKTGRIIATDIRQNALHNGATTAPAQQPHQAPTADDTAA